MRGVTALLLMAVGAVDVSIWDGRDEDEDEDDGEGRRRAASEGVGGCWVGVGWVCGVG